MRVVKGVCMLGLLCMGDERDVGHARRNDKHDLILELVLTLFRNILSVRVAP